MNSFEEKIKLLLVEVEKLHKRNELSKEIGPEYFEPGMMEYLDQSDGCWNDSTGELVLRFESRGTRYNGRTEQIERVHQGDIVQIIRNPENEFNHNNFMLFTEKGKDIGNMPAELCNVIAPLYDTEMLKIERTCVSFVDPLSKRNRHAKQAVLFVEMHAKVADV